MRKVTILFASGAEKTVELPGLTLMESAVQSGVDGIDGDCGGVCACGTCHIWMDQATFDTLPPVTSMGEEMLDGLLARHTTSRLSCRINAADLPADIAVHVPETQSW